MAAKKKKTFTKTHKLFCAISVSFSLLRQKAVMAPHFSSNGLAAEASCVANLSSYFQNPLSQVCRHVVEPSCRASLKSTHVFCIWQNNFSDPRAFTSPAGAPWFRAATCAPASVCQLFVLPTWCVNQMCCLYRNRWGLLCQSTLYKLLLFLKLWTFNIFFTACLVLSVMVNVLLGDDVIHPWHVFFMTLLQL